MVSKDGNFSTDVCGPQKMNNNDFHDPCLSTGATTRLTSVVLDEMSWQLLDGLSLDS